MPSPFPGMNPYLERAGVWRTFHHNFINAAQAALVAQVRPRYVVLLEPTLYIHEPPAEERRFLGESDRGLAPGAARGTAHPAAPAAVVAPVYGSFPTGIEVVEVFRIELRDREGNDLVSV